MKGQGEVKNSVSSSVHKLESRIEDVLALYPTRKSAAKVAKVSAEQLSRYAKGLNVPPFDVLARLAHGVNVCLDWLAAGEGSMWRQDREAAAEINQELLQMIVEETEIYLDECNLNWTPEKKARVIIAGYDMMLEERGAGEKTKSAVMSRLLKAAF
ncbi:MAG TPA: hypothetical protein ENI55_04600 [Alphaproteobacteria bacterium]|nr:hypothetical protein [Alphaproteobacteria bacterium]